MFQYKLYVNLSYIIDVHYINPPAYIYIYTTYYYMILHAFTCLMKFSMPLKMLVKAPWLSAVAPHTPSAPPSRPYAAR